MIAVNEPLLDGNERKYLLECLDSGIELLLLMLCLSFYYFFKLFFILIFYF